MSNHFYDGLILEQNEDIEQQEHEAIRAGEYPRPEPEDSPEYWAFYQADRDIAGLQ